MTPDESLDYIVKTGIESAKIEYADEKDPTKLEGLIEGFGACGLCLFHDRDGNFSLKDFDDLLKIAKAYEKSTIGESSHEFFVHYRRAIDLVMEGISKQLFDTR